MLSLHQREQVVLGHVILLDHQLGHLSVSHNGSITWEQLQAIKNEVWGRDARAIEIYPSDDNVVNSGNWRHLWRLGAGDFSPDLLAHIGPSNPFHEDNLEFRHLEAWAEAEEVFAQPEDASCG